MISHCPQIKEFTADFDKHFDAWKQYKKTIATCGAIILDKDLKHVSTVFLYSAKVNAYSDFVQVILSFFFFLHLL